MSDTVPDGGFVEKHLERIAHAVSALSDKHITPNEYRESPDYAMMNSYGLATWSSGVATVIGMLVATKSGESQSKIEKLAKQIHHFGAPYKLKNEPVRHIITKHSNAARIRSVVDQELCRIYCFVHGIDDYSKAPREPYGKWHVAPNGAIIVE